MPTRTTEVDADVIAAFRRGDEDAFASISRHHFRELHIHCYRMVGSFDEAEDLVQETLLRAWRNRASYEGRATLRTWLYRIATNACIDAIRRRTPRSAPTNDDAREPSEDARASGDDPRDAGEDARDMGEDARAPMYSRFPWLQPYPDALLDTTESKSDPPDARLVARETIELAFLATIQLLPAKQRAVMILRDVLGFSAAETAQVLDDTPAAVNSALQRARATIRQRRAQPAGSSPTTKATFSDLVFLQAYMDASQRGDIDAIVDLLRDDVRMTLFPDGVTWDGRAEVTCELLERKNEFGDVKMIPVAANRQPAVAVYRRRGDDPAYRAWAIVLLGIAEGKLREIATFASPELFTRFALPLILPDRQR